MSPKCFSFRTNWIRFLKWNVSKETEDYVVVFRLIPWSLFPPIPIINHVSSFKKNEKWYYWRSSLSRLLPSQRRLHLASSHICISISVIILWLQDIQSLFSVSGGSTFRVPVYRQSTAWGPGILPDQKVPASFSGPKLLPTCCPWKEWNILSSRTCCGVKAYNTQNIRGWSIKERSFGTLRI